MGRGGRLLIVRSRMLSRVVGSGGPAASSADVALCLVGSVRVGEPDPHSRTGRAARSVPAMRAAHREVRRVRRCRADRGQRDAEQSGGRRVLLPAARRGLLAVRTAATVLSRWHGQPGVCRLRGAAGRRMRGLWKGGTDRGARDRDFAAGWDLLLPPPDRGVHRLPARAAVLRGEQRGAGLPDMHRCALREAVRRVRSAPRPSPTGRRWCAVQHVRHQAGRHHRRVSWLRRDRAAAQGGVCGVPAARADR
jgi:hypothetical protein